MNFVVAKVLTWEQHFDQTYLVELVGTIVVILAERDTERLTNHIEIYSLKFSGLVVAAFIVIKLKEAKRLEEYFLVGWGHVTAQVQLLRDQVFMNQELDLRYFNWLRKLHS